MPIRYDIDHQNRLVLTVASGVLTDSELLEHKRKLSRDQEFEAGMAELSDVRGVDQLDVTPEGVRTFVAQDAKDAARFRDYKLAIVASEDLVFGMARMYQTLTANNNSNVAVLRSIAQARAWLGLQGA